MSDSWLADNQGDIKLTDKLLPGFWLTPPAFIIDNQVPFLPALLIAIGQDQDMAEHMGVNLLRYKVYAFVLSSFFTAIGGILWIQFFRHL